MENKEILSMQEVDFSKLKMPAVAVYKRPEDFPRKCVARVYDMDKPTEHILIKNTLAEIDKDIRRYTNFTCIPRGKEDAPSLVCVWM